MNTWEKIKVLFTIRQGEVGGGETHVLDLVSGLDKETFIPIVLSFTDGEMVDKLNDMGVKTYVIRTKKPFDFRVWNKVKHLVVKEGIRIIHAHGTRACSNSFWAGLILKIPIVYTVHGWSFHQNQSMFVRKMREMGEAFLCKSVQKTICVSNSCLNEGLLRFKIPNAVVINNGVNLERYNPEDCYTDIRASLGIAKHVTLVGYIARITEQKDPFTLMEAIRIVAVQNKDVHFLIVGDGNLKQAVLDFTSKYKLEGHVTFQSFRRDVPAILKAIDIYCLPSLWEGLPIGILEAMAMKKGIIASSVSGNDELITNNVNGLLVPVRDPKKLSESILLLHKSRNKNEEYGNISHGIVLENYNIVDTTRKIQTLLKAQIFGSVYGAMPTTNLQEVNKVSILKEPESLDLV